MMQRKGQVLCLSCDPWTLEVLERNLTVKRPERFHTFANPRQFATPGQYLTCSTSRGRGDSAMSAATLNTTGSPTGSEILGQCSAEPPARQVSKGTTGTGTWEAPLDQRLRRPLSCWPSCSACRLLFSRDRGRQHVP